MTTWDSLFPWEQLPPRQSVIETFPAPSLPISPSPLYTTLQPPTMIDPNLLYNESVGITFPLIHTSDHFDTNVSSILPKSTPQSSLMDIRLAAALSLPPKQACQLVKGNKLFPSRFCPHVPQTIGSYFGQLLTPSLHRYSATVKSHVAYKH